MNEKTWVRIQRSKNFYTNGSYLSQNTSVEDEKIFFLGGGKTLDRWRGHNDRKRKRKENVAHLGYMMQREEEWAHYFSTGFAHELFLVAKRIRNASHLRFTQHLWYKMGSVRRISSFCTRLGQGGVGKSTSYWISQLKETGWRQHHSGVKDNKNKNPLEQNSEWKKILLK